MNASENFVLTVIHSLSLDKHDDQPDIDIFPPDHDHLDCSDKVRAVCLPELQTTKRQNKADLDHKQEYDKEVLTMGLCYMQFQDAI